MEVRSKDTIERDAEKAERDWADYSIDSLAPETRDVDQSFGAALTESSNQNVSELIEFATTEAAAVVGAAISASENTNKDHNKRELIASDALDKEEDNSINPQSKTLELIDLPEEVQADLCEEELQVQTECAKAPEKESPFGEHLEEPVELIEEPQKTPLQEAAPAEEESLAEEDKENSEPTNSEYQKRQSITSETLSSDKMEFAKNYSDDLLMGQSEAASGGPDLADFELPPCSGSSSGSEPVRQQTPTKATSSTHRVSPSKASLTSVKNLLVSSYSKVSHIFYWKKPIETGIIFLIGLTLLTALTFFSIISVVAYTALGLMMASGSMRIYKLTMKTLNKSQETPVDHLWDMIQDMDVSLSPEAMHQLVDSSNANLNASLVYLKQVLLVQDKVATLKFALFLYCLTCLGAMFNGMTIITITYLALFSVPVFYEHNKAKLDEYISMVTNQISMVSGKLSSLACSGSSKKQK